MSAEFKAVQWNRRKIVYDAIVLVGIAVVIGGFILSGIWLDPPKKAPDWIDLRLRACGFCAFLMITLILSIGPLARLYPRFLPLLHNRRHFGVMAFCVALVHGASVFDWFYEQNALPFVFNELTTLTNYTTFIGFTTKALGLAALSILFVLAATSHDYWLAFLTPHVWKSLHMAIYLAYAILVLHVSLGIMQDNRSVLVPLLLASCFVSVVVLHLLAGWKERTIDCGRELTREGWIAVGPPQAIEDRRAVIVAPQGGERIAVFRDGTVLSAVTNLCAHQMGPLGEGRVIDGCIVCPWHGYEYRLEDGCAPPPFTEKLATYRLRLNNGIVEVDPNPLPPGTPAALRLSI
ncbi:MAG TPA: Rieske 2Fe-2S domain-containing protein [Beijerinckiaceae bacterium]|jgi:nitrite reductase/ring-hydroxylating ferredoxin subunit|nr:Rieske 2Fe-2S domain-containing protein [Beijerinckiaceae bacterium]